MIWFIIATLVAFFIKGLCGFANTLIFNGILSYTANNINISPLEVVLGYPSNIILVWKAKIPELENLASTDRFGCGR